LSPKKGKYKKKNPPNNPLLPGKAEGGCLRESPEAAAKPPFLGCCVFPKSKKKNNKTSVFFLIFFLLQYEDGLLKAPTFTTSFCPGPEFFSARPRIHLFCS
jgi:hypothetical protein